MVCELVPLAAGRRRPICGTDGTEFHEHEGKAAPAPEGSVRSACRLQ